MLAVRILHGAGWERRRRTRRGVTRESWEEDEHRRPSGVHQRFVPGLLVRPCTALSPEVLSSPLRLVARIRLERRGRGGHNTLPRVLGFGACGRSVVTEHRLKDLKVAVLATSLGRGGYAAPESSDGTESGAGDAAGVAIGQRRFGDHGIRVAVGPGQ